MNLAPIPFWYVDTTFTDTTDIYKPDDTVVLFGNTTATNDLTIRANNLVVLGDVFVMGSYSAKTTMDYFFTGDMKATLIDVQAGRDLFNGAIDQESLQRIRALGIDMILENDQVSVNFPH